MFSSARRFAAAANVSRHARRASSSGAVPPASKEPVTVGDVATGWTMLCMGGGSFVGIGIATTAVDPRDPLEAVIKLPVSGVFGAAYGALFAIGGPLYVVTAPVRRAVTGKWFWGNF